MDFNIDDTFDFDIDNAFDKLISGSVAANYGFWTGV